MRPVSLLFSILMIACSVQAQKTINDPNAEVRQVPSFHGIQVSNAFDVLISQSGTEALAVSAGDKEDVALIETEVRDGILTIKLKEGKNSWWPRARKLKAYVSVKTLDNIKAGGASDIRIEGGLKTQDLYIDLSGASDLKGSISAAGNLNIRLSGASDLDISGSAAFTKIDANGASDMDGYEFATQSCDAHASGASSVTISVDKEISAKLSGASSMRYKGSAVIKNISTSGASKISKKA
jgi:hypothetical protein